MAKIIIEAGTTGLTISKGLVLGTGLVYGTGLENGNGLNGSSGGLSGIVFSGGGGLSVVTRQTMQVRVGFAGQGGL